MPDWSEHWLRAEGALQAANEHLLFGRYPLAIEHLAQAIVSINLIGAWIAQRQGDVH